MKVQKIEIYAEFTNPEYAVEQIATLMEEHMDCELKMISRVPFPSSGNYNWKLEEGNYDKGAETLDEVSDETKNRYGL